MKAVSTIARRQDAHSMFLGSAAMLLALTLIVDLLFHEDMVSPVFTWALLLFCLAGGGVAFVLGRRVPRWIGILSVTVFIVAETFYLSLADDPQSVVSSAQQLPIVAFYLGWFIRPAIAGPLILLCLLVFGAVMWNNPLFAADGIIGAPVAVHALLALLFCYGAGLYLWRRQARAVSIDTLTEVFLRQAIMDRIAQRLRRSATFCVVMADFDDFKTLNDTRGHAAGDAALRDTTAVWRSEIRSGDQIGRIGGDEFIIVLPHARADEAARIVERLKRQSPHPWSAGITESRVDDTLATLLERADHELYAEKEHKRRDRGRISG